MKLSSSKRSRWNMTQITPSESELMQFFWPHMSNCAPSAVAQAGSWDTTDDVTKGQKRFWLLVSSGVF